MSSENRSSRVTQLLSPNRFLTASLAERSDRFVWDREVNSSGPGLLDHSHYRWSCALIWGEQINYTLSERTGR